MPPIALRSGDRYRCCDKYPFFPLHLCLDEFCKQNRETSCDQNNSGLINESSVALNRNIVFIKNNINVAR